MPALPTLRDVLQRYGNEKACLDRVPKVWWPEGLSCGNCGSRRSSAFNVQGRAGRTRHLYQCLDCRHQYSVTVGTVLHGSHVPLTDWFLAIYFMAVSKQRIPATQLQRILGVSYETAWTMKERLKGAADREQAFFAKLWEPE
jgi:transposase-like protein